MLSLRRAELYAVKTCSAVQVADANHKVKGTDVLVKVLSALHNGVVVNRLRPTPRSYAYELPQKFVALRLNLFTQKVAENKFVAVDSLNLQLQNC